MCDFIVVSKPDTAIVNQTDLSLQLTFGLLLLTGAVLVSAHPGPILRYIREAVSTVMLVIRPCTVTV